MVRTLKVLFVFCLLLLAGCGGRPPAIQQAQSVRNESLSNFVSNSAAIQKATLTAYKTEAYAHIETKHTWDQEMVQKQADKMLTKKANEQGKAPKDVTITAEEFQAFAKLASDWNTKVLKESEANKRTVDAKVLNVEELLAKIQKDLMTAAELDALITQWMDSGAPPELVMQAAGLIKQILNRNNTTPVPSIAPTPPGPGVVDPDR